MSLSGSRREFAPTDYNLRFRDCLIGAQMLFVAFGALVLVPILTGLDSNVALFTAGVGTLLFQICTRGKVPIFLASSFAFIAPIIYGVQTWGVAQTLGGLVCSGFVYFILSGLIRWRGIDVVLRVLPPVVTGPVIMVIGLILAPVAVNMALGKTGDGAVQLVPEEMALWVSMTSLLVTVLVSLLGRGFLRLMPITLAPAIEHFGDVVAISSITGRDYLKDPGVHTTMFGDGVATMAAGFVGGPPCTTYAEVIGAVSLTRVFNPAIMTWAALCAILLSFVSKIGAFLSSIPVPVMGGIMILLFGAIMVVGLNTLVRAGKDLMEPRNMIIVALIIIFGVGGMQFSIGSFKLGGIGLAAVTGVALNLFLPRSRS